jgi:hypothetical protein
MILSAAIQAESINVLDSYPFQNSVRILLQLDAPSVRVKEYAKQVEALVTPLQPVLIYFNHPDTLSAINHIKQICEQRGQAWTNYAIELATYCPYAENRQLEGFDGLLTLMIDYKQVTDTLLGQSRLPRLILENCSKHYDECYRQIEAFLELPPQASTCALVYKIHGLSKRGMTKTVIPCAP